MALTRRTTLGSPPAFTERGGAPGRRSPGRYVTGTSAGRWMECPRQPGAVAPSGAGPDPRVDSASTVAMRRTSRAVVGPRFGGGTPCWGLVAGQQGTAVRSWPRVGRARGRLGPTVSQEFAPASRPRRTPESTARSRRYRYPPVSLACAHRYTIGRVEWLAPTEPRRGLCRREPKHHWHSPVPVDLSSVAPMTIA